MTTDSFTPATTWQTVGPFFSIGLQRLFCADIAGEGVTGERIRVAGLLLDGADTPIPDALLEIWQANAHGKYAHPNDTQDKPLEQGFRGFGRIATDDNGRFSFSTVRPGSVPGSSAGSLQAPHLVVSIVMRGLLRGLVTRAYFPGDPLNQTDPVLALVPHPRRHTLLLSSSPGESGLFHWEIHMQGPRETVFFDF